MSISRETAGGRAYLDLQRRAKRTSRNTQELIQLYILEWFLAGREIGNDEGTVLALIKSVLAVHLSEDSRVQDAEAIVSGDLL